MHTHFVTIVPVIGNQTIETEIIINTTKDESNADIVMASSADEQQHRKVKKAKKAKKQKIRLNTWRNTDVTRSAWWKWFARIGTCTR